MTDVSTAALLLKKPSSEDDSGFRHGFEAESALPQVLWTPTVTHGTTRLCWIVITLWDCYSYADAVRALSWIFFYVFLLVWLRKSKIIQECGGWVRKETSTSDLSYIYIYIYMCVCVCVCVYFKLNIVKTPGDLKKLVVTQNPVKDHHLTLVWKTLKGLK